MATGKLTRAQWSKTPYAGTGARNTEDSVYSLMRKYNIVNFQWTQGVGPNGRHAVMYRFELVGRGKRGTKYRKKVAAPVQG